MVAVTIKTHTEPGGKEVNEDFLMTHRHPSGGERYVCLLADGQGGRSNGAAAARAACETALARALEHPFESLLRPSTWTTILHATDNAVCRTEGYTTLVALALDGTVAMGASCGDSKVFFVKNWQDAGEAEIAEWTSRQRKNPPVGSGEAVFEPFACDLTEGSRILVLSDGVWKYCGFDAIRVAFQMPDFADAPVWLKSATLKRVGTSLPDDFSVIAIDVE
jgi:hypothetical protein